MALVIQSVLIFYIPLLYAEIILKRNLYNHKKPRHIAKAKFKKQGAVTSKQFLNLDYIFLLSGTAAVKNPKFYYLNLNAL